MSLSRLATSSSSSAFWKGTFFLMFGSRLGRGPPRLDLPCVAVAPRGFSLANVGTLVAPTDCQTCPNFFSIASFATLNMK